MKRVLNFFKSKTPENTQRTRPEISAPQDFKVQEQRSPTSPLNNARSIATDNNPGTATAASALITRAEKIQIINNFVRWLKEQGVTHYVSDQDGTFTDHAIYSPLIKKYFHAYQSNRGLKKTGDEIQYTNQAGASVTHFVTQDEVASVDQIKNEIFLDFETHELLLKTLDLNNIKYIVSSKSDTQSVQDIHNYTKISPNGCELKGHQDGGGYKANNIEQILQTPKNVVFYAEDSSGEYQSLLNNNRVIIPKIPSYDELHKAKLIEYCMERNNADKIIAAFQNLTMENLSQYLQNQQPGQLLAIINKSKIPPMPDEYYRRIRAEVGFTATRIQQFTQENQNKPKKNPHVDFVEYSDQRQQTDTSPQNETPSRHNQHVDQPTSDTPFSTPATYPLTSTPFPSSSPPLTPSAHDRAFLDGTTQDKKKKRHTRIVEIPDGIKGPAELQPLTGALSDVQLAQNFINEILRNMNPLTNENNSIIFDNEALFEYQGLNIIGFRDEFLFPQIISACKACKVNIYVATKSPQDTSNARNFLKSHFDSQFFTENFVVEENHLLEAKKDKAAYVGSEYNTKITEVRAKDGLPPQQKANFFHSLSKSLADGGIARSNAAFYRQFAPKLQVSDQNIHDKSLIEANYPESLLTYRLVLTTRDDKRKIVLQKVSGNSITEEGEEDLDAKIFLAKELALRLKTQLSGNLSDGEHVAFTIDDNTGDILYNTSVSQRTRQQDRKTQTLSPLPKNWKQRNSNQETQDVRSFNQNPHEIINQYLVGVLALLEIRQSRNNGGDSSLTTPRRTTDVNYQTPAAQKARKAATPYSVRLFTGAVVAPPTAFRPLPKAESLQQALVRAIASKAQNDGKFSFSYEDLTSEDFKIRSQDVQFLKDIFQALENTNIDEYEVKITAASGEIDPNTGIEEEPPIFRTYKESFIQNGFNTFSKLAFTRTDLVPNQKYGKGGISMNNPLFVRNAIVEYGLLETVEAVSPSEIKMRLKESDIFYELKTENGKLVFQKTGQDQQTDTAFDDIIKFHLALNLVRKLKAKITKLPAEIDNGKQITAISDNGEITYHNKVTTKKLFTKTSSETEVLQLSIGNEPLTGIALDNYIKENLQQLLVVANAQEAKRTPGKRSKEAPKPTAASSPAGANQPASSHGSPEGVAKKLDFSSEDSDLKGPDSSPVALPLPTIKELYRKLGDLEKFDSRLRPSPIEDISLQARQVVLTITKDKETSTNIYFITEEGIYKQETTSAAAAQPDYVKLTDDAEEQIKAEINSIHKALTEPLLEQMFNEFPVGMDIPNGRHDETLSKRLDDQFIGIYNNDNQQVALTLYPSCIRTMHHHLTSLFSHINVSETFGEITSDNPNTKSVTFAGIKYTLTKNDAKFDFDTSSPSANKTIADAAKLYLAMVFLRELNPPEKKYSINITDTDNKEQKVTFKEIDVGNGNLKYKSANQSESFTPYFREAQQLHGEDLESYLAAIHLLSKAIEARKPQVSYPSPALSTTARSRIQQNPNSSGIITETDLNDKRPDAQDLASTSGPNAQERAIREQVTQIISKVDAVAIDLDDYFLIPSESKTGFLNKIKSAFGESKEYNFGDDDSYSRNFLRILADVCKSNRKKLTLFASHKEGAQDNLEELRGNIEYRIKHFADRANQVLTGTQTEEPITKILYLGKNLGQKTNKVGSAISLTIPTIDHEQFSEAVANVVQQLKQVQTSQTRTQLSNEQTEKTPAQAFIEKLKKTISEIDSNYGINPNLVVKPRVVIVEPDLLNTDLSNNDDSALQLFEQLKTAGENAGIIFIIQGNQQPSDAEIIRVKKGDNIGIEDDTIYVENFSDILTISLTALDPEAQSVLSYDPNDRAGAGASGGTSGGTSLVTPPTEEQKALAKITYDNLLQSYNECSSNTNKNLGEIFSKRNLRAYQNNNGVTIFEHAQNKLIIQDQIFNKQANGALLEVTSQEEYSADVAAFNALATSISSDIKQAPNLVTITQRQEAQENYNILSHLYQEFSKNAKLRDLFAEQNIQPQIADNNIIGFVIDDIQITDDTLLSKLSDGSFSEITSGEKFANTLQGLRTSIENLEAAAVQILKITKEQKEEARQIYESLLKLSEKYENKPQLQNIFNARIQKGQTKNGKNCFLFVQDNLLITEDACLFNKTGARFSEIKTTEDFGNQLTLLNRSITTVKDAAAQAQLPTETQRDEAREVFTKLRKLNEDFSRDANLASIFANHNLIVSANAFRKANLEINEAGQILIENNHVFNETKRTDNFAKALGVFTKLISVLEQEAANVKAAAAAAAATAKRPRIDAAVLYEDNNSNNLITARDAAITILPKNVKDSDRAAEYIALTAEGLLTDAQLRLQPKKKDRTQYGNSEIDKHAKQSEGFLSGAIQVVHDKRDGFEIKNIDGVPTLVRAAKKSVGYNQKFGASNKDATHMINFNEVYAGCHFGPNCDIDREYFEYIDKNDFRNCTFDPALIQKLASNGIDLKEKFGLKEIRGADLKNIFNEDVVKNKKEAFGFNDNTTLFLSSPDRKRRLHFKNFKDIKFDKGDEEIDLTGWKRSTFHNCYFGEHCKFDEEDFKAVAEINEHGHETMKQYFSDCRFDKKLLTKYPFLEDLLQLKIESISGTEFFTSEPLDQYKNNENMKTHFRKDPSGVPHRPLQARTLNLNIEAAQNAGISSAA